MSAAPPVYQERPRPKWWLWIGLGCFTVILLFAACVGAGLIAYKNQSNELTAIAEKDIKDVTTEWSADPLYARFDTGSKRTSPRERVERWLALFDKELGPFVEVRSSVLTKTYVGTNGRTGTVVSEVEFEKAIGTVTINYVYEEDEWKIGLFDVRSVGLEDALLPDAT